MVTIAALFHYFMAGNFDPFQDSECKQTKLFADETGNEWAKTSVVV